MALWSLSLIEPKADNLKIFGYRIRITSTLPRQVEAFRAGEDVHAAVAGRVHGVPVADVTKDQRAVAKMINFGIIYGMSSHGLSSRLRIPVGEANTIISDYRKGYPGIDTFLRKCVAEAREKVHGVRN